MWAISFYVHRSEIQITTTIETDKKSESPSSITLAGKKLLEILRILPDESQISIELKENKAQIKANKSRFSLQTLPAQDFPKLNDQLKDAKKIVIGQGKLKALFLSVQYAMAQQDVRYYLNGVLLIIAGNQMKMVATDGHRLAYNADSNSWRS